MISGQKKRQIRECLRLLADTYATAVSQIESTISLLTEALELDDFDDVSGHNMPGTDEQRSESSPVADRSTLSVSWNGRTCFIGSMLLFALFERLNRTPNRFVSHYELLDEVWSGVREKSTIRGAVLRLRARLIEAEMSELAAAIDGSTAGFYRLRLG